MKRLLVVGGTGFLGYHIISKAKKKLQYLPKVNVEEGVERYLKFLKKENKK